MMECMPNEEFLYWQAFYELEVEDREKENKK